MNTLNRDAAYMWSPLLVATALAAVVPGVAVGQSAYPRIVNGARGASMAAVVNFWTAERMAAATPMLKSVSGSLKARAAAGSAPATGAPGAAGGGQPGQPQSLSAPLSLTEPADSISPADGSFPGPHQTFEYFPRYRVYPISTIGKLFFTAPDGSGHYCTATVTTGNASNQDMIWTAGHCVAPGDGVNFNNNWLFCPSHDNGAPNPALGCWSWAFATTSNEWFSFAALSRDYAIIGLQPTGTVINNHVGNVTGSLGFAWNQARDQHWIHIGYPQDPAPWTGLKLIETAAEHRYDVTIDSRGPNVNSWGSAQGHGASGSAVILGFNYPNVSFINSDVSFSFDAEFGLEIQGPYFDTQVCTFWKNNTGFLGSC
jgi:hypothetical protein